MTSYLVTFDKPTVDSVPADYLHVSKMIEDMTYVDDSNGKEQIVYDVKDEWTGHFESACDGCLEVLKYEILEDNEFRFFVVTENGKEYIYRDVCRTHSAAVHQVLGTSSESALQRAIDQCDPLSWWSHNGYLGPDVNGLECERG